MELHDCSTILIVAVVIIAIQFIAIILLWSYIKSIIKDAIQGYQKITESLNNIRSDEQMTANLIMKQIGELYDFTKEQMQFLRDHAINSTKR